jgi:hypothetical protein
MMKLKSKVGLALLVAVALSAVTASAASATSLLTPNVSPAVVTGEQIPAEGEAENRFEITSKGTKLRCPGEKYVGTTEGVEVSEVAMHPTFSECTVAGLAATVDTTGCDLTLTEESEGSGKVHVICESGKAIEITIPSISCTIKIHEQTPTAGGASYAFVGGSSPTDVDATVALEGITYERVGTGVLCKAAAPSEGNDAVLHSRITLRAYEYKGTSGTGTLTQGGLTFSEGEQVGMGGEELYDAKTNEGIAGHVEFNLKGTEKYHFMGNGFNCNVELVFTTEGKLNRIKSYKVSGCVGTGIFKTCVVKSVESTGLPWTVNLQRGNIFVNDKTIDLNLEGCGSTTFKVYFKKEEMTPDKLKGFGIMTSTEAEDQTESGESSGTGSSTAELEVEGESNGTYGIRE